MLKNFRTHNLALEFYKLCETLKLPRHLKTQLVRAASSICLNLAEGSAKPTKPDQLRYYYISLGSLRECQSTLALASSPPPQLTEVADHLGACIYKLTRS